MAKIALTVADIARLAVLLCIAIVGTAIVMISIAVAWMNT